jgi:hypothetical protein
VDLSFLIQLDDASLAINVHANAQDKLKRSYRNGESLLEVLAVPVP